MAHYPATSSHGKQPLAERFLRYAGLGGIALAVVLLLGVVALSVPLDPLVGPAIAPVVFTLLLVATAGLARRYGLRRGETARKTAVRFYCPGTHDRVCFPTSRSLASTRTW